MPFLHGKKTDNWRQYAISEYDYSTTAMATNLGLSPRDARLFMVCDKDWKFIHAEGGYPPMLFDLNSDPDELNDLGSHQAHSQVIELMQARLHQWAMRSSQRTTVSDDKIMHGRTHNKRQGVVQAVYDENEVEEDQRKFYQGKAAKSYGPKIDDG